MRVHDQAAFVEIKQRIPYVALYTSLYVLPRVLYAETYQAIVRDMQAMTIIVLVAIGLGTRVVWGYVVLKLANLGVKHPSHQRFLIELVKSKKIEIPSLTLGRVGRLERKHDDNGTNR